MPPSGQDACKRRGVMLSAPLAAADASRLGRGGRVVECTALEMRHRGNLSGVRIPPSSAIFRTELRTPGVADFTPEAAASVRSRSPFDPMIRTSFVGYLDALGQGAEMFAAIAASVDPDALAGGPGEFLDHGGRDRLLARAFRHRLGARRRRPGPDRGWPSGRRCAPSAPGRPDRRRRSRWRRRAA